jgi:hypothetical protein
LENTVTKKIAGERSGDQLIDEPAGGDQQDGEEKDNGHELAAD